MVTHYSNRFYYLLLLIVLSSCAQIVSPDGGPRDTKGPLLLFSQPKKGETNIKQGEKLSLVFDEYIQIKDPANQWIVSPPMNGLPNYVVKGKELVITLPDSLRSQSTYVIQFGNSLADIHEGTVSPGVSMVFSTGSTIDSGVVKGHLQYAKGQPAGKGYSVLLFNKSRASVDSLLYNHPPDYYCPANDAGAFELNFLPQDTFIIYALKDLNKNFRYDPPDEEVGIYSKDIAIGDSLPLKLICFKEEPACFVRKQSNPSWGHYVLSMSAPDSLWLIPMQGNDCDWRYEMNKTQDSLSLWINYTQKDSAYFVVRGTKLKADTLAFHLMPEKDFKGGGRFAKSGVKEIASLKTSEGTSMLRPGDPLFIVFPTPFDTIFMDSLRLINDQNPVRYSLKRFSARAMEVMADWKQDSLYILEGSKGFALDFFRRSFDSLRVQFKVAAADELGTLTLTVEDADSMRSCIYKLVGPSGTSFTEIKGHVSTLVYDQLVPGLYHLEVTNDTNKNGKYDSGDLLTKRLPERIYVSQDIQVRANWDLEETILVNFE